MKKYSLLFVVFLIAIAAFIFWSKDSSSTAQIKDHIFKVDIVIDNEDMARGLSGRIALAEDEGMLFIYPKPMILSFWMKNMNFSIDLLWINNNKIVAYEADMLIPESNAIDSDLIKYLSPEPVDKVLEISAGTIEKLGIKVGDVINIDI